MVDWLWLWILKRLRGANTPTCGWTARQQSQSLYKIIENMMKLVTGKGGTYGCVAWTSVLG